MSGIYQVDLRKYFNRDTIAQSLQVLPALRTPVMDRVFPDSVRKQHPFVVIGIKEITEIAKCVPVVRRGSPAVSIYDNSKQINYIEPQGVDVFDLLSAVDLNNLRILDQTGKDEAVNGMIDKMRRVVRKTSEALCSQALTGKIHYAMKTESGVTPYEVDFGGTLNFTPPGKLLNEPGTKPSDALDILMKIEALIQDTSGYGSDIKHYAGEKAFLALMNLVTDLQNDARVKAVIEDKKIIIGGYSVELFNYSYFDTLTGESVKVVPDNKMVSLALDAPFSFFYLAIDDIEAGLQALPLWITYDIQKDPSAVKVIGRSKPLPVPVPKAICWSQVTA